MSSPTMAKNGPSNIWVRHLHNTEKVTGYHPSTNVRTSATASSGPTAPIQRPPPAGTELALGPRDGAIAGSDRQQIGQYRLVGAIGASLVAPGQRVRSDAGDQPRIPQGDAAILIAVGTILV
jgi:hypothetical protein